MSRKLFAEEAKSGVDDVDRAMYGGKGDDEENGMIIDVEGLEKIKENAAPDVPPTDDEDMLPPTPGKKALPYEEEAPPYEEEAPPYEEEEKITSDMLKLTVTKRPSDNLISNGLGDESGITPVR